MKNRYLLCLLLCGVLLYFAVPRLSVSGIGLEGAFAISWFVFAFIVIAGNLSALLFLPKKQASLGEKQVSLFEIKRLRGRS
ncbi:hypothetical protein KHA96_00820 [Bacillus sp. FJAT-49711]|uniref:hypothetical protein n=1 Tax=Bacillus sp. FJAT-49711 TaxID=2833585 RepID=UPI001BC95DA2|nr:hypothetical protein [Bacillus sp. FJAT-49711]MBS4216851.1 hypothetical protein [Bacillus sp. FJAT-49711]